MAISIENLRAILQIEDIDLIIKLLEQNDWDETRAASAHMSKSKQLKSSSKSNTIKRVYLI